MNKYRLEIDGLRAIAVLAVIFYHLDSSLVKGGYLGVDIFFVITGYLITSIIIKQQEKNEFKLVKFYERRIRRIIPILLVIIIISYLLNFSFMFPGQLIDLSNSILATLFFVSNFYFWMHIDYFNPIASNSPLLHTWTLAVEEQFYLVFPIFLISVSHFKKKNTLYLIIIFSILSFLLSLLIFEHHSSVNFYFTFTRAWEILIGSICAYLQVNKKTNLNIFFCYIGSILVLISLSLFEEKTSFPPYMNLVPVIGTSLIILFSYKENLFIRLLSSKIMVKIGLISYSLYLWHHIIFSFLILYFNKQYLIYGLLITFLISFYSWKYIEQPVRNQKNISFKALLMTVSSLCFIIISICVLTHYYNGFPKRFSPENQNLVNQRLSVNGKYTARSFKKFLNKPFIDNTRKNILIIGDSFGQDLSNILNTTSINNKYEISTLIFAHHCKKIFKNDLMNSVNKACVHKQKNDEVYNKLKEKADIVFLAINWNLNQYKRSFEALEELKKFGKGKIIILGIKDFGHIQIKDLIKIPIEKRKDVIFKPSKVVIEIDSFLTRTLNKDYLNQFKIICKNKYECPIFNKKGDLVSYDGKHLTKEGVKFFQDKINFEKIIEKKISINNTKRNK